MTDLAYASTGQGPPVLMVQGVGVAGCGWQPQVDGLSDSYELAWFDNRGIGNSPGRPGSTRDMAEDAFGVMDALGWESAHLVGHSLGGVIAQQMALLAPERVRSLALLCTFADGRAAISLKPAAVLLQLRTLIGTTAMRRRAFFALVSAPELPADEPAIARLERAFGRRLNAMPPGTQAQVRALASTNLTAQLPSLGIPALVISATHDRVAPPSQGQALAEALGGRFVEVPGGHAVTVQDAERVNELLRGFLS